MADCSPDPHFLFSGVGLESIMNLNCPTLKSYHDSHVDCLSFLLFLGEFIGGIIIATVICGAFYPARKKPVALIKSVLAVAVSCMRLFGTTSGACL